MGDQGPWTDGGKMQKLFAEHQRLVAEAAKANAAVAAFVAEHGQPIVGQGGYVMGWTHRGPHWVVSK